jgi:hypothetical protein
LGLSLFGSIITLSGLLIGFLLNQAQTNFREVQSLVSREAGQINNLDRLLARYGDPAIAPMRKELFEYMNSIVNDEWILLKSGQGSDKTHMLWRGISRKLLSLDPQTNRQTAMYTDILKKAEEVAESRESRIERSCVRLPNLFFGCDHHLYGGTTGNQYLIPTIRLFLHGLKNSASDLGRIDFAFGNYGSAIQRSKLCEGRAIYQNY